MRKILSLILGLLWALPAFADLDPCRNLFDKDSLYNINLPLSRNGFFPSGNGNPSSLPHAYTYFLKTKPNTTYTISMATPGDRLNIYGIKTIVNPLDYSIESPLNFDYSLGSAPDDRNSNAPVSFTTYDNTKMVAIYYSLYKEPTDLQIEEGDTATEYVPYCEKIKIATTKYNETKFSPLNTALANAISVVDSVVSNTITQAASIATLQSGKQTRPNDIADDNEKCPTGKKCLLVEDASGIPHWYEIVENAWDLPVGYTQLQWIKSTGAQWIDTGYVLNSNTDNVEIVFQSDSVDTNINLFGARGSTTSRPYTFGAYQGGWRFGWYDRSEVFGTTDTNKHTVKIEHTGGILKIDDVIIAEMGSESFTTPFNAALFGVMASSMYYGTFTIYSYKKWTNDELVQYFIPAQRNSDSAIGMYDLVSGAFFENKGTGSFIAGAPVSE